MNAFLTALVLPWTSIAQRDVVPIEAIRSFGFEAHRVHVSRWEMLTVAAIRSADGAQLEIGVFTTTKPNGRDMMNANTDPDVPACLPWVPQSAEGMTKKLPSQLHVGSDFYYRQITSMRQVLTMGEFEFVVVTLSSKSQSVPLNPTAKEEAFVERLARRVLSNAVARRYGVLKNGQLWGTR